MKSVFAPIAFLLATTFGVSWIDLWLKPDQHAQRLMQSGKFHAAAETFRSPFRQGVAWYRAGEFKKAAEAFSLVATPEATFNRGNCLVFQGEYEQAIECYDQALSRRPDWESAQVNRRIAAARAKQVARKGGEMGDQKIGADEIRFDKTKTSSGQETSIDEDQASSDAAIQALWLRRIQTRPADFLRSKFAFQRTAQESEAEQ